MEVRDKVIRSKSVSVAIDRIQALGFPRIGFVSNFTLFLFGIKLYIIFTLCVSARM